MIGIGIFIILLVLGLYLIADVLLRKLLCTLPVDAVVIQAAEQTQLNSKGHRKASKFPSYQFALDDKQYIVKDYNATRRRPAAAGDHLALYCRPQRPDGLWYVSGQLWQDFAWGLFALAGAVAVALLYR